MLNIEDIKELLEDLRCLDTDEIKEEYLSGSVQMMKIIRQVCKEKNLLSEQHFINWEDELNRISTMDPEEDLLDEILSIK